MSETVSKYAQFVDLLLTKTKQSKIPWEYDNTRNVVSVWNGDVLLNITRQQDEHFDDLYSIALFNRSGAYLEGFTDETLSEIGISDNEDNYFVRLRNLYDLAMRQATGADKALDEFIAAVQSDSLDIPF